jgi:osmotically-inducible protein OsmY
MLVDEPGYCSGRPDTRNTARGQASGTRPQKAAPDPSTPGRVRSGLGLFRTGRRTESREEQPMTAATITRTDQEIQRDVLEELNWEPRLQPNEVGVIVTEGVATLTGWVDNYAKKWAAERAAHRVNQVRAVANDIEVRLSSETERTDPDIAVAATRALEWDAFVPVENLDVTVANAWVVLRGEVEWEYQKRAAERSIRRLTSVRGVTNGITVAPRSQPSPEDLHQRIESALVRSVETDAAGIDIEVRGEMIILEGTVRSWLEREEAERVAWSAPGIVSVHNHLTVRL